MKNRSEPLTICDGFGLRVDSAHSFCRHHHNLENNKDLHISATHIDDVTLMQSSGLLQLDNNRKKNEVKFRISEKIQHNKDVEGKKKKNIKK